MSVYLEDILSGKNRATSLKVVFVDVVSYSRRRSLTQAQVIDVFMECLEVARAETAKIYLKYAEDNKISFKDDAIFLPAGDGAAICFPFEGLHDIHLEFAKQILQAVHAHNSSMTCEIFNENGWCNCHSNFNLAVGISDGRAILYKDLNRNYNVAGIVINMAARVMNLAGNNQILFTEEAYKELIDMVNDPILDQKFRIYKDIRVKHDLKINVYQYIGDFEYLNVDVPKKLAMHEKTENVRLAMESAGFPMPNFDNASSDKMMKMLEGFATLFKDNPEIINKK